MALHEDAFPFYPPRHGDRPRFRNAPRSQRARFILCVALLIGFALAARPVSVTAATLTFQVTTTTDAPDATPGDGMCDDASGQCTLRAAVQEADAAPSGSTITILVPAGTFPLKLGALSLTTNTITIQGGSGGTTTIDGRNASQVFTVSSSATVKLDQLTLANGNADRGGGIENAGTLTVTNSTISTSTARNGGGIYNDTSGTLTLTNSTVVQNVATGDGGGIANNGGTLQSTLSTISANKTGAAGGGIVSFFGTVSIIQSTVANNAAAGKNSEGGGGIANGDGTLTVDRSTISGNTTNAMAGGIFNIFRASISNSTISGNMSPDGASGAILNSDTLTLSYVTIASNSSGIVNAGSNATATGTIIANSTAGPNCFGNRFSEPQGFNLDSGTTCRFSQATDLTNTDPMLARLANNGGPTQTQALEAGSPAIDHGGTSSNGCPPTDQRGVTRPQGTACDIGAYEFVP